MARKSAGKAGNGQERVSPVKLAHVLILTRDLAAMRDWYLEVLDGRIVFENRTMCFVTYDDEHHRIALAALPEITDGERTLRAGIDHVAFTYDSLDDLLHTYRRLKRQGIEPFWAVNHGPTTSMYYRDPEGNKIELQIDNFAKLADAEAYMVAEFERNPIGVIVDPEALVARRDAGVPVAELQRRPDLPPGASPLDMLRI